LLEGESQIQKIMQPRQLLLTPDEGGRASSGPLHGCYTQLRLCALTGGDGFAATFEVPDFRAEALLRGDDEIATTLRFEEDIWSFVESDALERPWIHRIGRQA
jgi:hypothetical protein